MRDWNPWLIIGLAMCAVCAIDRVCEAIISYRFWGEK